MRVKILAKTHLGYRVVESSFISLVVKHGQYLDRWLTHGSGKCIGEASENRKL